MIGVDNTSDNQSLKMIYYDQYLLQNRYKVMDLAALRIFRAVVDEGLVTRAAERLNTVQSNVTTRIRQLEDELETPLFDRINRRLVITPAGQLLADYADRLLALADEATAAVRASSSPQGVLRLGTMETTAAARLPATLARFRAEQPSVEVHLSAGPTAELIDGVLQHRLDAALVAAPIIHPMLNTRAVIDEELALISAADWPTLESPSSLAARGPLAVFTFREGCSYRQRLLDWLRASGVPIARVNEFGTFEAIVGCIAAGMGVGLLPKSVLGTHLAAGTLRTHPTPANVANAQTLLIWHRERSRHVAREAFVDCLVAQFTGTNETQPGRSPAHQKEPYISVESLA